MHFLQHLRVETDADVQELGRTRNLCAGTFANDNHLVTPDEQRIWWETARKNTFAWIFTDFFPSAGLDCLVGFGLLKYEFCREAGQNVWWTSVGVVPEARGNHYGEKIVAFLVSQPLRPIYGSALRTNPAGVKVHSPDLWDTARADEDIILFKVRD